MDEDLRADERSQLDAAENYYEDHDGDVAVVAQPADVQDQA